MSSKNRLFVLFATTAVAASCGREPARSEPVDAPATDLPTDGAPDAPPVDDKPAVELPPGDEEPAARPGEEGDGEEAPRPETPAPPATGCTDDGYEPNDAQAQAKFVQLGTAVQAASCGGDADWFVVDVQAGCALTVDLAFTHADGDLDLALFTSDGVEVASSAGVQDGESATFTTTASGRVAARVTPYNGAENAFSLLARAECGQATTPPPAVDGCPNDADADASSAATSISSSAAGTACSGDSDWYKVDVQAGCTVRATMSLTHASGDIDLVLEDATGTRLATSAGFEDTEEVEAQFDVAGQARLGVLGYGANANGYVLSVEKSCAAPPLSCPADDAWEPNDSASSSLEIFDGETLGGIVCSNDVDVWALWVPQDCAAVVEVDFKHSEGDLDMSLYGPGLQLMENSARATDGERVVEVANQSGEHFIAIGGYAGAQNTYDVTATTVCVDEFACPSDDPFEPNDDRAAGVRLDGFDRSIGMTCGDDDWYYVDAEPGCTVEATLSFSDAEGDLDLEIVDGANDVVAESSGTGDVEQADTYVWVAGRIWMRVKPYAGAQARYTLDAAVYCP